MGAQAKAFERLDCFETEVVATSDLDKEVVCNYAAIHCGLTNAMINSYPYPSKEEMIKELSDKNLGYDFEKDKPYNWEKLAKKKDKTKGIEKYWLADKLSKNFGDITKIKSLPETNMLFYSSPCQDFSCAGKQNGSNWTCLDCGNQYNPMQFSVEDRYTCPCCRSHNIKSTRSGLLFEVERLLVDYQNRNLLPEYLVLENVANLVSKKFIDSFNDWVQRLDNFGYNTYWTLINAKDCGVPQSRNRCFAVSIRKDVDTGWFEFPKPFDLGIRLKDVLEDDQEVIAKYFLSDEIQARLQITNKNFDTNVIGTTKPDYRKIGESDVVYNKDGIVGTLLARDYKQPKQIFVGENKPIQSATMMGKYEKMMDVSRRVYDENGIAPTIHTCGGGNTQCKIMRSFDADLDENFIWKQIEKHPLYAINEYGTVINIKTKHIKSARKDTDGYLRVKLCDGRKNTENISVHKLVANAFLEKPDGDNYVVNHKDGDIYNNHYTNLEWILKGENTKHRFETLLSISNKVGEPRGITYNGKTNKWQAKIQVNNKYYYFGQFDKKEDAYKTVFYGFINIRGYQPWDENLHRTFLKDGENIEEYDFELKKIENIKNYINTETKISRNNLKVVRKLTPKEVFRLQSFDDVDYDRCKALGMSDSQAYKATGNSICVKCLELVFQHLYKSQYDSDYKCFDEEVLEYQNEMEHAPSYLNGDRDIFIAASRGRMNENGVYDQHLEIRSNEFSNTLTTVPTDNLVVEVDSGNFMNPPA